MNAKESYFCIRCGFTGEDPHGNLLGSTSSIILGPLSKSNDPPSATDLGVLRNQREDFSRVIMSLDQQIGFLQASMDALKQRREHFMATFEIHKSILHPCRRIPNEVLAIIFGLCVDQDVDIQNRLEKGLKTDDCPSTLDTKKSPWVLGQVSRRWRHLILSLHHLWTGIDINWKKGLSTHTLDPYIERRLSLTLQRAQDRPLFVSWTHASSDRSALASILFSRSFQWKSATIRSGIQGLRLLTPYSGAFPNLSSLYLHFERDRWSHEDEKDEIFSIFGDAPALHSLTLSGDSTVTPRLRTQVPWSHITRFILKGGTNYWSDLETVLPFLVNVEECHLHRFHFATASPITLTRLRSLTVSGAEDTLSINNLMESLTLPSLRKLYMVSE
ncbi:hypothetical protein L218DRAFT_465234 [Marasmius fiardii PR-910]|nr:hypothetical protein L218DRAFT_465234 [Marasmius fiardii PR-910]